MGRKPKPAALKLLSGNPGGRPLNHEPQPRRVLPRCPRWASPQAKKVWRKVAPALFELGLLTSIDETLLALLCQAVADFAEARGKLAEQGKIIMSPNGYPIINPWQSLSNKAYEQIVKVASEFGLSPSSRTRLTVDEPMDELAALLFEDVSIKEQ